MRAVAAATAFVVVLAGVAASAASAAEDASSEAAASVEAQTRRVVEAIDAALAARNGREHASVEANAREDDTAELAALARKAGALARPSSDEGAAIGPLLRAALRQREVGAYAALADEAARDGAAVVAGFRSVQMRQAIHDLETVDAPGGAAMASFWRLQADLFDLRRLRLDGDEAAAQATAMLERFVYELPDDDALAADLRAAALHALAGLGVDGRAIGLPLEARLPTAQGGVWSTQEQRGHWVLLAFVGDDAASDASHDEHGATAATPEMSAWARVLEDLRASDARWRAVAVTAAAIERRPGGPFDVMVVDRPDQASESASLASVLNVARRPAWVVLDPESKIASRGQGLAFLSRFVKIPAHPLRWFDARTGESQQPRSAP